MIPHPNIDPVAIHLGPLQVHWYGLMYLIAFAFAWVLAVRNCKRPWSPIKQPQVEDLITYGFFGVFLGGRLGYKPGHLQMIYYLRSHHILLQKGHLGLRIDL